jgi:ribosomal protein S18 acetylase RimI-like enzyme
MGRQKNEPRESTLRVRDALHEDIPGICATMPEAFGLVGGFEWQDPDYIAEGLASCAALSGRQKIKVALLGSGSQVVGSSFSGRALAPDGQTAHPEIGVIHGIAVRPESRRTGAASALLTECEAYLVEEGARVMVAEVRPGAVAFFGARGYEAATGPALAVPSSAGTYVHRQSVHSTVLMWKACRSEATVIPEVTEQGTVLAGVSGGRRRR